FPVLPDNKIDLQLWPAAKAYLLQKITNKNRYYQDLRLGATLYWQDKLSFRLLYRMRKGFWDQDLFTVATERTLNSFIIRSQGKITKWFGYFLDLQINDQTPGDTTLISMIKFTW
ncbi:MAG TPA: hypothetical protein VKS21_00155, partial [Spirochaetota bacterium]|nr:hypothetical protein [Spirochaetota bacterium]